MGGGTRFFSFDVFIFYFLSASYSGASISGALEAQETENDHGKEKGERRNACDNSIDFSVILLFS